MQAEACLRIPHILRHGTIEEVASYLTRLSRICKVLRSDRLPSIFALGFTAGVGVGCTLTEATRFTLHVYPHSAFVMSLPYRISWHINSTGGIMSLNNGIN